MAVRSQRESEERARVLAENVAAATLEQIRHKFDKDFQVLLDRRPGEGSVAKEAALDAKYLAKRQATLTSICLLLPFSFDMGVVYISGSYFIICMKNLSCQP